MLPTELFFWPYLYCANHCFSSHFSAIVLSPHNASQMLLKMLSCSHSLFLSPPTASHPPFFPHLSRSRSLWGGPLLRHRTCWGDRPRCSASCILSRTPLRCWHTATRGAAGLGHRVGGLRVRHWAGWGTMPPSHPLPAHHPADDPTPKSCKIPLGGDTVRRC